MLTGSPRSKVWESVANTAIEQRAFMVPNAAGDVSAAGADAANIVGIAMESRTATTGLKKDVTVALPGQEYEVICGGTVAAGARLKSDASGHAVAAGNDDPVAAIALAAGVDGDIIPVIIAFCTQL